MKSQHATLERYLGPGGGGDRSVNAFSQKSLHVAHSQDIGDSGDLTEPNRLQQSFEYDPRLSYNMPSSQLLPSNEVEKQGIQTPLQYRAAVMAA